MSFWSRLTGPFRKKSSSPEDWFREFGGFSRSHTGVSVTQTTAMQASTVMACVSILSEDVAKLPAHVYRRRPDGGQDIVKDHPVERLLQKPNAWQTRFEFIEQMQAALLLRKNAYAPILRDGRGKPIALIPVNPDRVILFEAPGGGLFYSVARHGPHDMAVLQSFPLMIPAEDMLHLRGLSRDGLTGMSLIGMARESIGLSLAQQEHAARLFGNGARPGGILRTEQKLDPGGIARLKADWQQLYGGVSNDGKTAVLEQGLEWQPLGMTNTDAQFLESRRFSVEEIARLFRMPLHKLGVESKGGTAGTAIQADQDYMNSVVSSYVERWEAKIDDALGLAEEDLFCAFDISRFLRADIGTRYGAYRTGIVGSFMTPNQARRLEGWPDDPNGDVLLQPVNMAPLGFVPAGPGAGPGSDMTGDPAAGGKGDPAAVDAVGGD